MLRSVWSSAVINCLRRAPSRFAPLRKAPEPDSVLFHRKPSLRPLAGDSAPRGGVAAGPEDCIVPGSFQLPSDLLQEVDVKLRQYILEYSDAVGRVVLPESSFSDMGTAG